ncbi:MAG: hypothetical protein C0582_00110 [Alphaproteobacteria bacterium]|nr:MAG: hypothetical protein C0582_00110 [Alphaproteobacteria bacterium]
MDDTTFSDCVETALFNVITHAIAEKREGIIYLNRDRLNQGTPVYRYLEEFSDMAANQTGRARDHRANMIANLPANLGVSYSKDDCELYSSASTFANAMIYLLGLADQHRLSERASQAQIRETYDAIGGHLGVTFRFEGEIVTLLRDDSALGNLQIIHGNHIEYTVWDTLEDESSFSDLFGKVKKYEDALALAGVADADSYLKLQKAVRDFDQALTPSQNVQIYQAFAQQALSNDARILAAYEGFRILPKRPEIFPDRSNEAKKEREVVLRVVQSVMKELSDANDPATIKKLHEHINLNYMQGHMKFISSAEFAQIISAAPNLFRLIDRREPKAPKEELLTKLNILGTADADATSWNVLPDGKFGDLRASMADNIFSTRDIFDGHSSYAYDALVCNCHTLYVNPEDYGLSYTQFKNSKTIGFDPRLASDSYMFSKSNRFIEANPIEVRLLGLAHVDTLVQEFLPSLVQNESHRFKMLSLGDNTLSYNPFEVEKGNTTFSSVVEWLVPNNHKPRTTYGGLVHSFITEAFRVMPDDKVINIGFTQTSEKLD